jgi:hypothetical protein
LVSAVTRATLLTLLLPAAVWAQEKTIVRESDPEERRGALIGLWDARPGSDEARSGMTYQAWLAAQPGASSAMFRATVPVPAELPKPWRAVVAAIGGRLTLAAHEVRSGEAGAHRQIHLQMQTYAQFFQNQFVLHLKLK